MWHKHDIYIWYQAYISFVSLWSISKLQVKRHAHWQYIAIHTRWSTVSTTSLLGTWSTFNRLINRPNFSSSLPVDFRMSSVDPVDVPFFSSAVAVSDISAPFTMQTPRYCSPSRVNLELSRNTHTNAYNISMLMRQTLSLRQRCRNNFLFRTDTG